MLITMTRVHGDSMSLTAAALLPCCQQFEQITRAVTLCHKILKELDQILSRFRLLNRLLPVQYTSAVVPYFFNPADTIRKKITG